MIAASTFKPTLNTGVAHRAPLVGSRRIRMAVVRATNEERPTTETPQESANVAESIPVEKVRL